MKTTMKYLAIAALSAVVVTGSATQGYALVAEKCSELRGKDCKTPGEIKKCEGGQSGKEKCVICKSDKKYSGPTNCPADTAADAIDAVLGLF